MAYALNAITAPDAYSQAATIENMPILDISLDVVNQPIYWQLKLPVGDGVGGGWDTQENYMTPGSRTVFDRCVGIRVRAAVLAAKLPAGSSQAVVTVRAAT